jgi:hypothetical protein
MALHIFNRDCLDDIGDKVCHLSDRINLWDVNIYIEKNVVLSNICEAIMVIFIGHNKLINEFS